MPTTKALLNASPIPVDDLRKLIDSAAIPVRLAAVGRISAHVTASYVTFGQIAAGSITKGHPLPRGASYEDAI